MVDAILHSGWLKPLTLQSKEFATQCLLVYEVLVKRQEPIEQFIRGLDTLGIALIKAKPMLMECYFVHPQNGGEPLTSNRILELFENIYEQQEDESKERARGFFY